MMLFRCLTPGETAETAVIDRLRASRRNLVSVEDAFASVDIKSNEGANACTIFLDCLEAAAQTQRLDMASRSYRTEFSANYRYLLPDEARRYRVDILDAAVDQKQTISVNGRNFEFSEDSMCHAEVLKNAWADIVKLLGESCKSSRAELRRSLVILDFAWANFERAYITELIGIESQARLLLVQAIEQERTLQLLEGQYGDNGALSCHNDYSEGQELLVKCLAELNAAANDIGKGRDDFDVSVLRSAESVLRSEGGTGPCAARFLAADVIGSFSAMRDYLRRIERCLEHSDPQLRSNAGLVSRLVDLERSWEVGARYVQDEVFLEAICDLVADIAAAERIAPGLRTICEERDVQLFFVIPRIVWLRFLLHPDQNNQLLKVMLPHRFPDANEGQAGMKISGNEGLDAFLEKFHSVKQRLPDAGSTAWEILTKTVVTGSMHEDAVFLSDAVEDFMHDLEKFSLELQRHLPQDWNQCIEILVRCFLGESARQSNSQFRV